MVKFIIPPYEMIFIMEIFIFPLDLEFLFYCINRTTRSARRMGLLSEETESSQMSGQILSILYEPPSLLPDINTK